MNTLRGLLRTVVIGTILLTAARRGVREFLLVTVCTLILCLYWAGLSHRRRMDCKCIRGLVALKNQIGETTGAHRRTCLARLSITIGISQTRKDRRYLLILCWLITTRDRPETNIQAVPAVNGHDRKRQIHKFPLAGVPGKFRISGSETNWYGRSHRWQKGRSMRLSRS